MTAATPQLEDRDRALLAGEEGAARRVAMRILLRLAELQGAARFIDVTRAHIDGCIYTGDAILRFAETLAELEGRVAVPTTTNVISLDRRRWRDQGVDPAWADKATRLADAYLAIGAEGTFTCTPYEGYERPGLGEHIAWAESNAIAYANGVLGARTNRYGDLVDACAALTGRVPLAGYHLDEPRLGTVLFELDDISAADDALYPVLGYLVGAEAGSEVPVVSGLDGAPADADLKAFAAATATSGAVGMFHVVGVTPEAPTLADALGGRAPQRTIRVTRDDLARTWAQLGTSGAAELACVMFGSPHFSLEECRTLARAVAGTQRDPEVTVLVTTSAIVHGAAERLGLTGELEAFGARFVTDTCVLNSPVLPPARGAVMTNSAKYAHYSPGMLGRDVFFGSLDDCVRSAVAGRPLVEEPTWLRA
jgi:predicted aconitase